MTRRKLALAVSAMLLAMSIGQPLAAEPSLDELAALSEILSSNDIDALREYLETNPDLLEGEGRLAVLLRQFLVESADPSTYLAFQPDLRDALSTPAPVEEGSDSGDEDDADPDPDPGPDPDTDGSLY